MRTLVIGSRGSQLALWQANYIAGRLKELDIAARIEIIRTTGDHLQTASLLAAAGLRRLGLEHEIAEVFSPEQMCPAPGQGALAIETRSNDEAFEICRALNHVPTENGVLCERTVLSVLGGGCQLPVGAFAEQSGNGMMASAVVIAPDGSKWLG